jgi:hypothetical protein
MLFPDFFLTVKKKEISFHVAIRGDGFVVLSFLRDKGCT